MVKWGLSLSVKCGPYPVTAGVTLPLSSTTIHTGQVSFGLQKGRDRLPVGHLLALVMGAQLGAGEALCL